MTCPSHLLLALLGKVRGTQPLSSALVPEALCGAKDCLQVVFMAYWPGCHSGNSSWPGNEPADCMGGGWGVVVFEIAAIFQILVWLFLLLLGLELCTTSREPRLI